MSDCYCLLIYVYVGDSAIFIRVITTYNVVLDILSADFGSFWNEDLCSHFKTLVRILESFCVGS